MLPPGPRVTRALELVDDGKFFSLIAGHQTGKTTCLQWMTAHYNAGDRYRAIWVDLQTARDTPDPAVAMRVILSACQHAVKTRLGESAAPSEEATKQLLATPQRALVDYLREVASALTLPLVVLFDEADGLVGETMVSFLSQLRDGYLDRATVRFAHSVALVGRRAVRDYTLSADERRVVAWLGSSSPFNVNAEVMALALFTRDEVATLLAQHTTHTGQRFEDDAVTRVFELTEGQPWLVNALADYAVDRLVRDRSLPVTVAHIDGAKEAIIFERRTHIDSLVARLREERVKRVIAPMLAGERASGDVIDDDFAYVAGLGLIRREGSRWVVANPIYREVIPRALTFSMQMQIDQPTAWYVTPDGSLDAPKLMAAWQNFWRKDGHLAAEGFSYRESGPHLMLMAFLQRVVNGGGRIEREYALGKGALDLLIAWRSQRIPIEVKLRRDTETEDDALEQVLRYLDALDAPEAWLILFDLRSTAPWKERLYNREVQVGARLVRIVGC